MVNGDASCLTNSDISEVETFNTVLGMKEMKKYSGRVFPSFFLSC